MFQAQRCVLQVLKLVRVRKSSHQQATVKDEKP